MRRQTWRPDSLATLTWLGSLLGLLLVATSIGCGGGDAPTNSIGGSGGGDSGGSSAENDRSEAARKAAARREAELFPVVEFTTNKGAFKLKLDRAAAEMTVDNFLEYVSSGFYDNTIFHQVERDFVVAAGGYTADLRRKNARVPIRNEANNALKNTKGTVAMVRSPSNVHSATSQFMINLNDNPQLNYRSREPAEDGSDQYGYCVFGKVVEGWEVIEAIAQSPVQKNQHLNTVPTRPVIIESARRVN